MWLLLAGLAYAGPVVGAMGVLQAPLESGSESAAAPGGALFLGWRQGVGPLHLQPEIVGRYVPDNRSWFAGPGLAVTVGKPVAFGAYGHVGLPEYGGLAWDAGAIVEVTAIPKVVPALRVGYEQPRIPRHRCGDCPQPAEHMLAVALALAIKL